MTVPKGLPELASRFGGKPFFIFVSFRHFWYILYVQ